MNISILTVMGLFMIMATATISTWIQFDWYYRTVLRRFNASKFMVMNMDADEITRIVGFACLSGAAISVAALLVAVLAYQIAGMEGLAPLFHIAAAYAFNQLAIRFNYSAPTETLKAMLRKGKLK